MTTFEYTLFDTPRDRFLVKMNREASFVWNHALALQKRYYSLFGKYINVNRMQKHFGKKIKRHLLYSQTVQEILQRLDQSFQRFFKGDAKRPPKFKKAEKFSSFVFKGSGGYKLYANMIIINRISKHFKFFFSRPYNGNVKTVRIKRRPTGRFSLYITTDAAPKKYKSPPKKPSTIALVDATLKGAVSGKAEVGMDFGIKTFLTLSDGTKIACPGFLNSSINKVASLNRKLSRCQKGSNGYKHIKEELARLHEHIANCRKDWHWKLSHELCRTYDDIYIEDLDMAQMQKMWGRKASDMGFASFVVILEQVASKYGCKVKKVDRYFASSKTCCLCGYVNQSLTLRQRTWTCPCCGYSRDRDLNAAVNILLVGRAL